MHITPTLPAYQNSFYSTITRISYFKIPPSILKIIKDNPQLNAQPIFEDIFSEALAHSVVFYTDESKIDDSSFVGSAIFSLQLDQRYMFKLSSYTSVFTAEAWAIYYSLLITLNENLERVTIISDSKSVLNALSGYNNQSNNYIICYIRALVEEAKFRNTMVFFIWIPSHRGIRGNETVDLLAKRAIREGSDPNFKVPYSDLFYLFYLSREKP